MIASGVLAAGAAVLTWWLSTGVILALSKLPRRTFGVSLALVSVVVVLALIEIRRTAGISTPSAAYTSFLSAIAVWGWIETAFVLGFVTGPRTAPCPPTARGWTRFRFAAEAVLYHELAIIAGAAGLIGLTWGAPNQTGTDTFLILAIMRVSAKLNIFLGVPNLSDDFLPAHLTYMKSYFRKRNWNWLFPVSLLGAVAIVAACARAAWTAGEQGGSPAGGVLLAALAALALVEHLFMMMPVRDAALWTWAVPVPVSKGQDRGPP